MATTIRDIATRAGVSVATVSRVINGTKPVTDSVRDAVLAAISDLDYTPSRLAQNLRSSRTHTISFIVSSIENPFFPELIEHVTRAVAAAGYDVHVSISSSPLTQVVALHKRKAFDGVFVVGGEPDPDAEAFVEEHRIPVVAIDRAFEGSAIPAFLTANEQGAFECTSHLLQRSPDADRILHIQGPAHLHLSRDRRAGFLRATAGHAATVTEIEGDFTPESGQAAMEHFLDSLNDAVTTAPTPPLVFADNDLMAIGAISAAARHGLAVGRDVLVAGFDGINLAQWVTPALTTYNQPIAAIATAAADTLLALIDGTGGDGVVGKIFEFTGELAIRQSSGGDHA
ncbi:LacI family DNA-binding transcriptional regulator [Trueperella pecoris]|uniref:LacI family DNA-binding transcriptional regulator n=1 Tax=Trueperella pecoris TaxID=2733571 RepID=A0A7M1R136_9ACTO|nr:LacI family DNA-binding transcriptional regulator [Trueperella pecoris]QOR48052.1 LacI family DNA-binding transcriptional regulator [Trueperella pecoris]